jgi:uncharacterized FAD-dependent dehydrogenase
VIKTIDIRVTPENVDNLAFHVELAKEQLFIADDVPVLVKVLKRSIDARNRNVVYQLRVNVYINEVPAEEKKGQPAVQKTSSDQHAVIVGAGPAGLFAALELIKLNIKPIVVERGKNVRDRRRDLAAINKQHIVNPESNYCFGEGGAGTFSDGKLYTRSNKRGDVNQVLETLVQFGASEDILLDAHPHIGTNKLPVIIQAMREYIISCGGEVLFDAKLTDIIVENNAVKAIQINNEKIIETANVILATGHSARDIFKLLHKRGIAVEAKPFALGVRIEHPQILIDQVQYHCEERNDFLPPASYSLVHQTSIKPVYSFCMCPGGIIAPCATEQNQVVTNGWSPSKRNNPYANSGIVVALEVNDFDNKQYGALSGMYYQQAIEEKAHLLGGGTQAAPAQRMSDFIYNKVSSTLPETSYTPGITSVDLKEVLPPMIAKSLQEGLKEFGKKMKGYLTNDAVLHAVESRTSSPVRIPRDKETFEHIQVKGLYPCAEGAGYAGGIMSAAIDGQKCAEAIAKKIRG